MIPPALLAIMPRLAIGAAVAAAGWSAAWWVQGVRLQAVRNELAAERNATTLALARATEKANAQHDQTAAAWAAAVDDLRRRRAAGWVPNVPATSAGRDLPTAGRADDAGPDAVPSPAGTAPAADAALIADCQMATMQLNALQEAIERQ